MKVLWLLDELGLRFERVDAGLSFGQVDTPEYAAMNPLRLVPVLQDGGFTVFESNAILRYLVNAHAPEGRLYSSEPRSRATVDCWMDAQQTALVPPMGVVFQQLVRVPAERRDVDAVARSAVEAARVWTVVDAQIALAGWVADAVPTLADFAFGPHAHRWFSLPVERPRLPALERWYRGLLNRPAYAARCALPLA